MGAVKGAMGAGCLCPCAYATMEAGGARTSFSFCLTMAWRFLMDE